MKTKIEIFDINIFLESGLKKMVKGRRNFTRDKANFLGLGSVSLLVFIFVVLYHN